MKTVFVYVFKWLERGKKLYVWKEKEGILPYIKNFTSERELFNQSVAWQKDSFPHKRYFAVITGGFNGLQNVFFFPTFVLSYQNVSNCFITAKVFFSVIDQYFFMMCVTAHKKNPLLKYQKDTVFFSNLKTSLIQL